MAILTQIQYLSVSAPGGTCWDDNYLYCLVGDTIKAYARLSDGTLSSVATSANMGLGQLLYVVTDKTYLYISGIGNVLIAVIFNGVTFTQVGSSISDCANIACTVDLPGVIFATYPTSSVLKRLTFNGSAFTVTHSVTVGSPDYAYALACCPNYVIMCRHTTTNSVTLHNASNVALLSSVSTQNPDGAYIDNNIAAIADDGSLKVYNVSGGTLSPLASLSMSFPSYIADNLNYDRDGNFHIFMQDRVRHVYFDGATLTQEEDLILVGGSGDVRWQSSSYYADVFYVTKGGNGLFAIRRGAIVDFYSDVVYGFTPLAVQFNDASTGTPSSWLWDFGDGDTSTLQDPLHTYDTPGIYTVSLTADGLTSTKTNYLAAIDFEGTPLLGPSPLTVNFSIPLAPVASFTYAQTPSTYTIVFTNMSTGSIVTYAWDFGDGYTTTEANPSHTYATPGDKEVSLTVSNSAGDNKYSITITVF